MSAARVRAGTSGWSRPEWRGSFYPPDLPRERFLDWYTRYFDTVEVWTTAYRVPDGGTAKRWRRAAGGNFKFCLRYPRSVTESLEPYDPEAAKFYAFARELGECAGPLILTLGRRWDSRNAQKAERFLELVPPDLRVVVDGRNPRVFTPAVRAAMISRGFRSVFGGDEYPPPAVGRLSLCVFSRREEAGTEQWAAIAGRLEGVEEFFGIFTDDWEGCAPLSALRFGLAAGAKVRDWRDGGRADGMLF